MTRRTRILGALALLALAGLLSGCMIVPHYTQYCGEIKGIVLDVKTKRPIQNAEVVLVAGRFHDDALSRSDGSFAVGPLRQWHWLIYIGDPGHYPTPYLRRGEANLGVSAPGYEHLFDSANELIRTNTTTHTRVEIQMVPLGASSRKDHHHPFD